MGSTKLIRYLNDRFRSTFQGGQVILSRGIRALPKMDVAAIMLLVSTYDDFTAANDLYEEHDYASFNYKGSKIIFKIDYYDKDYKYLSPDPSDITKTNRVLTIMLAEEY